MNVRKKMLKRLVDLGLSEAEASEVFRLYEASDAGRAIGNRFNQDATHCPSVTFATMMKDLRNVGAAWMDKNAPGHDAYRNFHGFTLS